MRGDRVVKWLCTLTLSGGDEDVDGVDLVQVEVVLIVLLSLSLCRILNDSLLAIDTILLELESEKGITLTMNSGKY